MIRPAVIEDIPKLLTWGRDFAEACKLPGGFDPASAETFFRHLITDPGGILLVAPGGAIGGMVHPSPYNHAHLTGQELFWWVDPEHRGARVGISLLNALMEAVEAFGAHSWTVSSVGLDGGSVGRILDRKGFVLTDRNYTKTLKG